MAADRKIIHCGKSDEADDLMVFKEDGTKFQRATPEKGRGFKCGDPIAGDHIVLCRDCAIKNGFEW